MVNPTESDEIRHIRDLSDRQYHAIDELIGGGTVTEAATAVGVSRQTASAWINHHPGFRAALSARRHELRRQRADLIRRVDVMALQVLADALDGGDEKVALQWVKLSGAELSDRLGPTSPEEIIAWYAESIRSRPENMPPPTQEEIDLAWPSIQQESTLGLRQAIEMAEQEIITTLKIIIDN